jgi:DNA topoisomerase IB
VDEGGITRPFPLPRRARKQDHRSREHRADRVALHPAGWRDVWISPRATAKLQATGIDSAGRRQYLYHPDFRAQQEREEFQKLTRFAAKLPDLRAAMIARQLNAYIASFMGEEFSAKDFRTLGRNAARGRRACGARAAETEAEATRTLAGVMRMVGAKLGNTPAVARESYVSPAVIEQYLMGRTLEDFRPRHLRVVGARDVALDHEEQALLSLLRSWRLLQARQEAGKAA